MDFQQALTFMFKDEDWIKKVLLGVLISLIPIFGQLALVGYMLAIIQNVKNDEPRPLPDWSEVIQYFVEGLKSWVVSLVYSLPVIVLSCPLMLIGFVPLFAGSNEELMGILAGVSGVAALLLSLPAMLYGLLLGLLSPVLLIRLAETGEISDCLRVREVVRFTFANISLIIIALLVMIAVAIVVVTPAMFLTLGLLGYPAAVWTNLAFGHLCGQIARQADWTAAAGRAR
jgi:hypothetical protein